MCVSGWFKKDRSEKEKFSVKGCGAKTSESSGKKEPEKVETQEKVPASTK